MEPFSVATGVTTLLCTTGQVIQYLNSVRSAPKEQAELAQEMCLLHGLLISLDCRFKVMDLQRSRKGDDWSRWLCTLAIGQGALEALDESLSILIDEIQPRDSQNKTKITRSLTWHFKKESCSKVLAHIERVKSDLTVALSSDNLTISKEILDGTNDTKGGIAELKQTTQTTQATLDANGAKSKQATALAWIDPPQVETNHEYACNQRHGDSGEWFLQNNIFKEWKAESGQLLWISGIRKSTISQCESANQTPNISRSRQERSRVSLVEALWRQL